MSSMHKDPTYGNPLAFVTISKGLPKSHQLLKDGLHKHGITENLFLIPRKVMISKKVSSTHVMERHIPIRGGNNERIPSL